jgi:hypothetical protein
MMMSFGLRAARLRTREFESLRRVTVTMQLCLAPIPIHRAQLREMFSSVLSGESRQASGGLVNFIG